jgi:hypothetical protein
VNVQNTLLDDKGITRPIVVNSILATIASVILYRIYVGIEI